MRRCCTSGAAGEAAGSTDRATTAKPKGIVGRVVRDLATTRHCVSASSFIASSFGASRLQACETRASRTRSDGG